MQKSFIYIIMSILLGVTGQFLYKYDVNRLGPLELSPKIALIFLRPLVFAGIACYVLSTFTWLVAISRVPLSVAYPMISAGYVLVFIISILFLGEKFHWVKLIGILLICAGITLLYMSFDKLSAMR